VIVRVRCVGQFAREASAALRIADLSDTGEREGRRGAPFVWAGDRSIGNSAPSTGLRSDLTDLSVGELWG
jgi:hypothetical protein